MKGQVSNDPEWSKEGRGPYYIFVFHQILIVDVQIDKEYDDFHVKETIHPLSGSALVPMARFNHQNFTTFLHLESEARFRGAGCTSFAVHDVESARSIVGIKESL